MFVRIQGLLAVLLFACQPTTQAKLSTRAQTQAVASKPVEVAAPVVRVHLEAPGYSALEMEARVTEPIEASLLSLNDVARISSESLPGRVVVQVQFTKRVDLEQAYHAVRSGMDGVAGQLPDDVAAPVIEAPLDDPGSELIVAVMSTYVTEAELSEIARKLESEFAMLAGVSRTQTCISEQQLQISLDPTTLAALGQSLDEIAKSIRNQAPDLLKGGTPSLQKLSETVISIRGELPVRLGDVGSISKEFVPGGCRARLNGQTAVTISAWIGQGDTHTKLAKVVENLREQLPENVKVHIFVPKQTDLISMYLPPGTGAEAGLTRLGHLEIRAKHWLVEYISEQDRVRIRFPSDEATRLAISEQVEAMPGAHLGETRIAGKLDPALAKAQISGIDVDVLQDIGQRFVALAASSEGVVQARILGPRPQPELAIEVDDKRLAALGLNRAQVLEFVTASRGGQRVTTTFHDGRQVPVIVTIGEPTRSLEDMGFLELTLATTTGRVPLRELVTVRRETAIPASLRVDGRRVIEVAVRGASKTPPSSELRTRVSQELELPAGYTLEWRDP